MRVAGKGIRRKVRFHVMHNGCWVWVIGCGWEMRGLGRWGELSPRYGGGTSRCHCFCCEMHSAFFSSTCIPTFWNYFPSQNTAPTHSPQQKNWAQIVILNQESGKKIVQKYSSCLTKHVYCKTEMYARLVQQIIYFAYRTTALWPKNSKEELSLNICVWRKIILYVKSIPWQSFIGTVLGEKLKQDGDWMELRAFSPFRSSRSWLDTCVCSVHCCASMHIVLSWTSLLNPVYSNAHMLYASLGIAVYSSNKYKVQRFHLFSFNTVRESGVKC